MFLDHLHLPVDCVDHSQQMLTRLAGVTDPEKKRKIIGGEFIECFKNFKGDVMLYVCWKCPPQHNAVALIQLKKKRAIGVAPTPAPAPAE